MAEINNALAAQIQVPKMDLGGTLAKAAQINSLNAETGLKTQEFEHRKFLYDQGKGYNPSELQTLQSTRTQQLENAGRIGSAYLSNPTDAAWSAAVDEADKAGLIQGGSLEKAQYLSMPPEKRAALAKSLQQAGMSSSTATEQTGIPAYNRASQEGRAIPQPIEPGKPYTNRTAAATGGPIPSSKTVVGDDEGVRKGLYEPTPEQRKRGVVGPDEPSAPPFQPRIVRNKDGTISSSVTPETQGMQEASVTRFKQMQDTYGKAQNLMGQIDQIEHENETLNSSGWSSTGTGANAKLNAAKSINSLFTSFGIAPPIDPERVASWEGYNKQTIRAGFELARTLGGHSAEGVVQSSVSAVPNVENTYFGSKVITNSIRQTIQREIDMYRYSLDYAKTHNGSTFGAEDEFNRKFPPKFYSQTAIANSIPTGAVDLLRKQPDLAKDFDAKYGRGMSSFIMSANK